MKHRNRNRIVFAVALAGVLFLSDSAARMIIVLASPHLAPLIIPDEAHHLPMKNVGVGYPVMDDHAGPMYNIVKQVRITIDQPIVYNRTVYVFGNSGAFGLYVADADTMESHLQALLKAAGYRWRVVNLAVSGAMVSDEYKRLLDTPLTPGDLVVFDDGAMNLVYGRCADNRFAVPQLACQLEYRYLNANATDIYSYERIIALARASVVSRGAEFWHFIQPTPYGDYVRGAGTRIVVPDDTLMDSYHLTPAGEALEARALFEAITTF